MDDDVIEVDQRCLPLHPREEFVDRKLERCERTIQTEVHVLESIRSSVRREQLLTAIILDDLYNGPYCNLLF